MRHKLFTHYFIGLLLSVIGFSSCCSIRTVAGVIEGNSSWVGNESYDGSVAGSVIGYETMLCPALFYTFYPNFNSACDCLPETEKKWESLVIVAGMNYSRQGGKYKEDYGLEGKVITSYLNLPLLIRYRARSGFYAEAGLQPGVLLSARDKYLDVNEDYSDNVNGFHLGLPIGTGYEFKNGIGIGIRIVPGLTSIHPTDDVDDLPNKNSTAGLRLSYTFKLKKAK